MAYKPRIKSSELQILMSLNNRMNLTPTDKKHYLNLKKGYEGEVLFDSLAERLQCERIILNDVLLQVNNTHFQIDSLIITSNKICLFEIKNYEGDYYYKSDKFFNKTGVEIVNPLHQLSRCESLLHQLLLTLGYNLPIDASVVFINPEFTLYQAPTDKPIIFPTQIKRYLNQLGKTPGKLTERHKVLADKLLSLHIPDSPFKQLPSFDYNQLRKGITCKQCNSFSISIDGKYCNCNDCGHTEKVDQAVLRCIHDFKLLFPDQKITTQRIIEWCKVIQSKNKIRRILEQNFQAIGHNRWTFYE